MSLFYTLAYWVGFRPWETAAMREAGRVSTMFDREESIASRLWVVLDLGCSTVMQAVELARRGWQVTGVRSLRRRRAPSEPASGSCWTSDVSTA